MKDVERRVVRLAPGLVEVRAYGDGTEGSPRAIEGRWAVYNSLSENLGGFRERIEPGFFTRALEESDPRGLFNHDPTLVLARLSAGTLEITDGERGADYRIPELADTVPGRDTHTHILRGDVTGNSFAFNVFPDGERWDEVEGELVRTLLPGGARELFDVGPVTWPAYPATTVQARCLERARDRGLLPADVVADVLASQAQALELHHRAQGAFLRGH